MAFIRDCVHSGLCPFGMVFIRDGLRSGCCSFGIVSIRDCVHLELCPFGIVSIRDGVHSGWCPFGRLSVYRKKKKLAGRHLHAKTRSNCWAFYSNNNSITIIILFHSDNRDQISVGLPSQNRNKNCFNFITIVEFVQRRLGIHCCCCRC